MTTKESKVLIMKIKKLNDNAIIPTRGSEYSAGYDLYSTENVVIEPHQTYLISTGWAIEIELGYFGAIFARSGLAAKEGLRPANCVGVIDSDYRGPVKVALHNDSELARSVTEGERIAQLIIIKYSPIEEFNIVEELEETKRDAGGFGSTGK